jgi:hypothetical protein
LFAAQPTGSDVSRTQQRLFKRAIPIAVSLSQQVDAAGVGAMLW